MGREAEADVPVTCPLTTRRSGSTCCQYLAHLMMFRALTYTAAAAEAAAARRQPARARAAGQQAPALVKNKQRAKRVTSSSGDCSNSVYVHLDNTTRKALARSAQSSSEQPRQAGTLQRRGTKPHVCFSGQSASVVHAIESMTVVDPLHLRPTRDVSPNTYPRSSAKEEVNARSVLGFDAYLVSDEGGRSARPRRGHHVTALRGDANSADACREQNANQNSSPRRKGSERSTFALHEQLEHGFEPLCGGLQSRGHEVVPLGVQSRRSGAYRRTDQSRARTTKGRVCGKALKCASGWRTWQHHLHVAAAREKVCAKHAGMSEAKRRMHQAVLPVAFLRLATVSDTGPPRVDDSGAITKCGREF